MQHPESYPFPLHHPTAYTIVNTVTGQCSETDAPHYRVNTSTKMRLTELKEGEHIIVTLSMITHTLGCTEVSSSKTVTSDIN